MSKPVDPLALLRDYYSNEKPIKYDKDQNTLSFSNNYYVPIDAKTAWIK